MSYPDETTVVRVYFTVDLSSNASSAETFYEIFYKDGPTGAPTTRFPLVTDGVYVNDDGFSYPLTYTRININDLAVASNNGINVLEDPERGWYVEIPFVPVNDSLEEQPINVEDPAYDLYCNSNSYDIAGYAAGTYFDGRYLEMGFVESQYGTDVPLVGVELVVDKSGWEACPPFWTAFFNTYERVGLCEPLVPLFTGSEDGYVKKLDPSGMTELLSVQPGGSYGIGDLVYNDGYLYAAYPYRGSLRKLDSADLSEVAYADPDADSAAWGEDGYLYVGGLLPDGSAYAVLKMDPTDLSIVDTTTSGGGPKEVLIWGGDGFLYAATYGASFAYEYAIERVDPSDMSAAGSLSPEESEGLAWAGGYLYTVHTGVKKIDPATMSVVDSVSYTYTHPCIILGGDGYLYVGGYSETSGNPPAVKKVDPSDLSLVSEFVAGDNRPLSLAWGSDGYLYAGYLSSEVIKIDPANMTQAGIFEGHTSRVISLAWGA